MATELFHIHVTVHGKVQGVSYRYFSMQAARQMGLTGWVRNRFNRTVELVAEGARDQLEQLLEILHTGPRSSKVTQVEVSWQDATDEFNKFKIRMTR